MKVNKHSWPNFPWKNLYENAIKRNMTNNIDSPKDIESIQKEKAPLIEISEEPDFNNETQSSPEELGQEELKEIQEITEEQILPLPTGRGVPIF